MAGLNALFKTCTRYKMGVVHGWSKIGSRKLKMHRKLCDENLLVLKKEFHDRKERDGRKFFELG